MTSVESTASKQRRNILFAILTALIVVTLGLTLTWFTRMYADWRISAAVSLILALLIAGLVYWGLQRRQSGQEDADKEALAVIRQRQRRLAEHFQRMLKSQRNKKRLNSRYDLPVYLLLSADMESDKPIITQMGYDAYKVDDFGNDIEFPILFWQSEHSILISISRADDQHPDYIRTLCKQLMKWRPRQAVNGLLVTTDATQLIDSNEQIEHQADEVAGLIKAYNQQFGLNLPVYNLITAMGGIADFCQFFSGFEEARRDDVFGATMPYRKHGGIDANWFNDEFDHLISQLIAHSSSAMANQLNQDYRNAIGSAPFQLGLLKQKLWLFLQRLYRGEQLTDALQFRGFYFTHHGKEGMQSDLLAATVNQSLGSDAYLRQVQLPVTQSLFAQNLMSHVILNEQQLVGVNRRKENMLWLSQSAYTVFWLALFGFVLLVIKLDFDYQSQREARADNMLESYKEAIAASPYNVENMADNIPNLYALHSIYALYKQPEPWFNLPFLPSATIKPAVEQAYFNELRQVLIPSMENTLEKDLFVYVNLEDQSQTLALLNNYRMLFDKQRSNIEELKTYFVRTLQDQGEADSINIAQLDRLLDDVFAQQMVPVKVNYELETLAKKVISQSGIENLLYQHILNAHHDKRIDVRKELGSRFSSLFNFAPDYVGYMVPYLYTPAGFNELDLSVTSPIIKDALQAYEGVAGNTPSAAELYRISRDLKLKYQNDYINYWRNFTRQIELVPITNAEELNRTLTLLSDASDNPLSNLYTLINKYTSVELSVPAPKDGKDNAQPELNIDADKKESARQITLSFQAYHDLLTANEQNQKPLDMVMADLASAQTWLKQFYQSKEPQKLAFQTLAASLKADNPITTLASASPSSDTLLQSLLSRITKQSNDMVMSLAHDYLNTTWREQVFQPYQQTLAAFYPFDTQSDSDASIADVKAFFMTNGTLDTYHNAMLKTFTASTPDSSPYLPGLLPDSGLALDPQVWQMLSKAKDIRQALFINDPTKVSVQFQVKAVAMSSDLTEFSISSEKPLFTYRHGPALWTQYNWLGDAQTEDKLDVALKAQSAYVAKANYTGNWNWFRLIEPRVTNTSAQNTQIEFDYGESSVKLAIKTQGQNNPFVPGFFSAFSLPGSL